MEVCPKMRFIKFLKYRGKCLEFQGCIERFGYGRFWYKGSLKNAHRVSWELFKGDIPEGMNVLHKCDNRKCVNTDHLFLGTHLENMKDMTSKGRSNKPHGDLHGRSKLTYQKVLKCKELRSSGFTYKCIAKKYGVSVMAIHSAVNGKTWRVKCVQ